MRYDLESTLPERAFSPRLGRGFGAHGMTLEGGKGGGGNTTQSTGTTYNTNIPEYAQPYVENMLGATQKQLFNMDGNEITGFKPYQPYSTNVNDYVAGFSPLQQQAQQATGQLGVPSQYGQATQMTGMAGMGSLGLAGQMAGAGQNFAQQAQDPNAMQGYMSPYMQNVVDYQKSQALRDYNIGQGVRKAQSVGQGAFGGNRQALMEAEAQRSLGNQLQGITAQGSQQAFQDAQKQQQFGAQLGLQGQQGAMQGLGQYGAMGAQLGQLGGQELAARQGIIQSQYGMGQQQQAMEQQKINQAMQDWANTQQYPLMQLGVMSNMLRGLPMQASTTNQYQAAPNALTQGIGAAGAGASLYNALKGGKEGGLPSEFKSTGIKSYYEGDVVESTKSDLYDLPLEELEKRAKSSTSPTIKRLASAIAKEKRMGLAGGGIIAFKDSTDENNQSLVKEDPAAVAKAYRDAAVMNSFKQEPKPYVERSIVQAAPAAAPVVEAPVERANPALVRQAQIDAALLEGGNKNMPKNLQYVEGATDRKQFLNPDSKVAQGITRQNLAGTGLSFEEDVAKQKLQQDLIESGAKRKGPQAKTFADLSEDQKAKFFAAIEGKTLTTDKKAPTSISSPEDAAKLGPEYKIGKPAGIKAAAPATAVTPVVPATTGTKTPGGSIAAEFGLERPAEDPYAKMSVSEIAKEKLAFLGPDVRKEERAGLMAERANAKDEARRTQSLRFAEFFADWGSRPGSTIAAGLTALKEKVPSIVSDSRKEAEIRRAINKDIAGLDKADRLEKAGAWDEAAKLKSDLGKEGRKTYGDELNFLSARLTDKRALEVAKINQAGKVEAAGSKGGFKTVQEAENALDKHLADNNKFGSEYSSAKAIVKAGKADYEAGKFDEAKKKRYEESLATINKRESREKELRNNIEFFKQNKGMPTTSSGESSGVDLNSFWKQGNPI